VVTTKGESSISVAAEIGRPAASNTTVDRQNHSSGQGIVNPDAIRFD
jgi:hypothetical protein